VHLDLRSVVCLKSGETAIAIAGLYPGISGGSIPASGDIESGAREFNTFSRNLEVGLATTIG